MKKCVNCGFIVHDDAANFCPECGNNLVAVESPDVLSGNVGQGVDSTVTEIVSDDAPAAPAAASASDTPVYTWFPPAEPETPALEAQEKPAAFEAANESETTPVFEAALPESAPVSEVPPVPETPAVPEVTPVPEAPSASETSINSGIVAATAAVPVGMAVNNNVPETANPAGPESSAGKMSMPEAPAAPTPNDAGYTGPVPVAAPDNNAGPGPKKLSQSTIVEILDRNIDMTGKVLGSSWFILAIVGFIVFTCSYIVDAVFSYINPSVIDLDWLAEYELGFEIDFDELHRLTNSNLLTAFIGSLIVAIPMVLSCIGGIMMIINSKKRPIPSSGTTLAKTNLVFKLVVVIICAIGSVCFMIASFLLGDKFFVDYFGKDGATAFRILMFFIALILIVVFLCFIFYYIGMIKTLTVAKKAGLEGKCPKNRVSIYAAVINIIASVFLLIGFILNVLDINNTTDIINTVVTCSGVIYFFCAGMSMFRLKDYLTELPGIK